MKNRFQAITVSLVGLSLIFTSHAYAGQGAGRMLYTVPNSTFIENPSGDNNVVTINDTSGSISTLQTLINNASSANPNSIIVIHLMSGATYWVNTAGLVLSSQECLIGTGATIEATNSSVTVPLITISAGSTNVSVAGGTLNADGASIYGIYAPSSSARINIDKVTVFNCGLDCIQLNGKSDGTFDNEMTVTRCDVSGSPSHSGISIWNATQATCVDNNCHSNSAGIWLANGAYCNIANNTCEGNTTGIDFNSGNNNYIANNTCNNNGTGILLDGSSTMVVSDSLGSNTVAGINSSGSGNIYVDNLFLAGNAANFTSGGSGDDIVAYKGSLSASGQNYFYPPLIDNQHTVTTIVNGKGRTDITNSATTTIDAVQSQYNAAVSANPGNVIVLHLNGSYTVGANPLALSSYTCVLLNGTIQINSSTTAGEAVTATSGDSYISISGGTIDGGTPGVPTTGREGIYFSGISMYQIDAVTLQHFGTNSTRVGNSDVIVTDHGSTPRIITRCTVNGSSGRGIWLATSGVRDVVSDNTVTDCQMDGVDCDESTSASLIKFNYLYSNTRYGVFVEQSASYNCILGNICNDDSSYGVGCYNNSSTPRGATAYNSVICNSILGGGGLRNGSTGTNIVVSSDNFFFDNTLASTSVHSDLYGTQNYYSQNYLAGTSLATSASTVFFNSPDAGTNLYVQDSNSRLYAVITNASTSGGAAVITGPTNMLGSDQWSLVPTDSGYYQLKNLHSGLDMNVSGASLNAGAPVIQYPFGSGKNDQWMPISAGNGLYNLVNRLSGLYLDVPGASLTAGAQLDQQPDTGGANQQFNINGLSLGTPSAFSLSASPASQTVAIGSNLTFTVTVTTNSSFSGSVNFGISGLPADAGASFSPASLGAAGNSTLTVTLSNSTPAGNYTLTIYGTNAAAVASATVALTVVPPSLIWNGNLNGNWDTSTANWQGGLTYQQSNLVIFDDSAQGTANVNLTTALSPASLTVSNASKTYIFSGSGNLSGATGLFKADSGTLVIDNSGANTFSGGTVINAGTIQIGNNDANGSLPGNVNDSGTLDFDRSDTALNVSGTISGTGSVIDNGSSASVVTLSANNNSFGGLTLDSGTLVAALGGSINASSGTITFAGGTLEYGVSATATNTTDYSSRFSTANNQQYNINIPSSPGSPSTYGSVVVTFASALTSSGGVLNKSGAGELNLGGANTFNGGINLGGGTLRETGASAFNGNTITETTAGTQVYFGNAGAYADNLTIQGYGSAESDGITPLGAIRMATANVNLSGTITLSSNAGISQRGTGAGCQISGEITGPYGILFGRTSTTTSASSGILILSNTDDSWTGDTTIADGTLKLGATGVIPSGSGYGNVVLTNAGTSYNAGITNSIFDLNGYSQTINGLSNAVGVTGSTLNMLWVTNSGSSAATLTVGGNNATGNFGGIIGGALSLTKVGTGTQILDGVNTYTGNTTISNGVLALSGSGSISNTAVITVAAGATLDTSGRSDQTLTVASGQKLQGGGAVNVNLTVAPGATIMPGNSTNLSTLTVVSAARLLGTTFIKLNATAKTNDQINASGFTYGGTLTVTNLSGTLKFGQSFRLFTGASFAGTFSVTNLPPLSMGLGWSNSLATDGRLQVVATTKPLFAGVTLSGTNLFFNGNSGVSGGAYVVLSSSNIALPLAQWLPVATNNFDNSGNFSLTIPADPNAPQSFYIIQLQ